MSNWRDPSESDLGPQYSSRDFKPLKATYTKRISEEDSNSTEEVFNSKKDSKFNEYLKYIIITMLALNIFFSIYLVTKVNNLNTQIDNLNTQIDNLITQIIIDFNSK